MRSTDMTDPNRSLFPRRFIFYDFESAQDDDGEHFPNLVVSHSICDACGFQTMVDQHSKCDVCGSRCQLCDAMTEERDGFENPPCYGTCGFRENIFQGSGTVEQFCQWLFAPQHKGVIAMAHNAKGYDAYFIYRYMVNNGMKPEIIFQGSKIMYCRVRKGIELTLLDSLNFLPMALSNLPKSFDLNEMKKGYFPHLFNKPDTPLDLVLPGLPDVEYYDPDSMRGGRRREFLEWYEQHKNDEFRFGQELLDYCRSDVNILMGACWKFRQLVKRVTGGMEAFKYVTIASLCMGIFRTCFLSEEHSVLFKRDAETGCNHEWECSCVWTKARKTTGYSKLEAFDKYSGRWMVVDPNEVLSSKFVSSPVALPPPNGYCRKEMFSRQSLLWMKDFARSYPETIHIQTALSDEGEKKVSYVEGPRRRHYLLDGYFRDSDGIEHALEFNGCFFHGCPRCFPDKRDRITLRGKTLVALYRETLLKENKLKEMGFKVHTMWACDYERLNGSGEEEELLEGEVEGICNPLDLRKCYFGGRTNALTLLKDFSNGENKAGYVDFCSLYPYALKYFRYPIGHPTRVVTNFKPLESGNSFPYFGVIKARVLPPRGLFHPVLPHRCNGKLTFPLCRTCAESKEQRKACECSDDQRSFTGEWCTPEFEEALRNGYKVVKIMEVLHWEESSDTLFREYINTFLKLKAEASGFPQGVNTEEERHQFVQQYQEKEGVCLEMSNIVKNSGLRSLAKLALNSFYGKFGQRQNMKKCMFITDAKALYRLLGDPSRKVCDFHILSEDMMAIEHCGVREFQMTDPKTNVIFAAFCTTYARLHLLRLMQKLGRRVLYHDTDSVIYSYQPGEWMPPLGERLGELTDEISCKEVGCRGCVEGHWIVAFVSGGPKNYAYRLNTGQVVTKVRGFSLNYSASRVVNMTSMEECLHLWKKRKDGSSSSSSSSSDEGELITITTMFCRNKVKPKIYTSRVPKRYNVVYDKRRVLSDFQTLPYGY